MARQPKQLSLFSNIQMYNLSIDKTLTVRRLGRQGILYEYELPYGANPLKYYEEAVNVKSIKGNNTRPTTKKDKKGYTYRTGMYQPIGDKRYFTYYQIKKMGPKDWLKWLEVVERRKQEYIAKRIREVVFKEFGNNG